MDLTNGGMNHDQQDSGIKKVGIKHSECYGIAIQIQSHRLIPKSNYHKFL